MRDYLKDLEAALDGAARPTSIPQSHFKQRAKRAPQKRGPKVNLTSPQLVEVVQPTEQEAQNSVSTVHIPARSPEEQQAAQRIKWLRQVSNDLVGACDVCLEAASTFPQNSFFPILAVDLLLALKKPAEAARWLVEALRRWEADNRHFAKFAANYHRVERLLGPEHTALLRSELSAVAIARPAADPIRRESERLLGLVEQVAEAEWSETARELGRRLDQRSNLQSIVPLARSVARSEGGPVELVAVLDKHLLNRDRRRSDMIVDEHFLAAYEEIDQLGKAFKIAESLLQFETRPAFAATFLRLCRKLEDYSPAAQLLQKHGELLNSDVFSLLYELVYYYEASSDLEKAKSLLSRLEELFEPSQPIQTTVRNFYLRLGLLNDAQRLDAKLASKLASKRARPGSRDEAERRQAIATKAKEVGAEVHDYLLHQQQLAAISELTRGISHELGQPITNVRYTVQFYMMEFDRELTKEKVKEVFDVILRQTERMGDLVKRLSPLTSSRHLLARFDACERIRNNLDAVATRLKNLQIKVFFPARVPIWLEGDTGHFDQITSNLIVNAIDALAGSPAESGRYIQVELREIGQSLQMTFEDNGPGFPVADRRRLFNPFYTTKPPGKGEGLGLFIVWNLLKMQGGTISLDSNYTGGARFRVTIRKNAVPMEKDEI